MERKAYFKDGVEVTRPLSVVHKGVTYLPPTDKVLLDAGYEIKMVEDESTEVPPMTYKERVIMQIRMSYSLDDELAILRQRDTKPEEFEEYNKYCEECKEIAKSEGLC